VRPLTDEQLADKFQVKSRWIEDRARDKRDPIPAFKAGRTRRFMWNCPGVKQWEDLEAWIQRQTNRKK
jgi:hypothetical protein